MRIVIASLFVFLVSNVCAQTKCVRKAPVVLPVLSVAARHEFENKLAQAQSDYERQPNVDNHIWVGRRTAYLGRYKEAIAIFTDAIAKFPNDARLYRHRGHRFITLRCFDAAIADLQKAAALERGRPDTTEPDGLPNSRNVPTSTLQSNIWYHLGLARYLSGDFRGALSAYREAARVSASADMAVATTHWLYMTLRRLGRRAEAAKAIASIGDDLDIIENDDYYKLIKLYQGKLTASDLMHATSGANNLSNATLGYGIGNWHLYNGRPVAARKSFRRVVSGNQWASFGYIAAETELRRQSITR